MEDRAEWNNGERTDDFFFIKAGSDSMISEVVSSLSSQCKEAKM